MMMYRSILLVEDNPRDEELTLLAFEQNGIRNPIHVARDGVEALDFLFNDKLEPSDYPALIVLDLKLPKVDGLEVLQRIRQEEKTKYLSVVVLTSSGEEQDILKAYDLGTNAYVRKPVEFEKFMEAVKQLGLFWLILNETPPYTRTKNYVDSH